MVTERSNAGVRVLVKCKGQVCVRVCVYPTEDMAPSERVKGRTSLSGSFAPLRNSHSHSAD